MRISLKVVGTVSLKVVGVDFTKTPTSSNANFSGTVRIEIRTSDLSADPFNVSVSFENVQDLRDAVADALSKVGRFGHDLSIEAGRAARENEVAR